MRNIDSCVILPLSRQWRADTMYEQLQCSEAQHHLVIVDNHEIKIDWDLENLRVLYMDDGHPGESNSFARRQRIADILNLARSNIPVCDKIILLEDDSELPQDWHNKIVDSDRGGITSGIQAGRWAASMLGAWKTDNIHDPNVWETLPLGTGTQAVDATGLYYAIVDTELFRDTPFRCTYQGPDVNFGLDIRRKGYQNYTNWELEVGHALRQKTIWPTLETGTLRFIKDELAHGGWRQTETVYTT